MNKLISRILFVSAMLLTQLVHAGNDVKQEFSADAFMQVPYQPPGVSKIYVSERAVRTESEMNGKTVVEIVFPAEQRRVILFHEQKKYAEQKLAASSSRNNSDQQKSPCLSIPGSECELLGKEKIDGRNTEKWQVTVKRNGSAIKSLHWIDKEYRMALREFFSDSSISELKLMKKEKMNGRNTEKWQRILTRPDGSQMESFQWYDPALGIAIREELPNGFLRELKNIKVAKQDKKLFTIPDEYSRWKYVPQSMQQPGAMKAPSDSPTHVRP